MNLARLNHILIPETAEARARARRSRLGRLLGPLFWLFVATTPQGQFALILWCLVGGLGLEVGTTQIYLVWCVVTGVLLGSALTRRWFGLDGVSAEVDVPRRVTVGQDANFAVRLVHKGSKAHHGVRVEGPYLPWDGRWVGEPPVVGALLPGRTAQVRSCAVFRARGSHHLESFRASLVTPLGLFLGPAIWTGDARFLVVPRIARVARLATPAVRRYQPGGIALASKTGESMEILGVRPYRAGDPVRDLHARTWARIGAPAVRDYQEEYFTRLGVVVDTDTAVDERQFEAALSLAAGVVAHLSRGESLIDLLVVGNTVHTLTLGRSLGFLDQALDLLACVTPGAPLRPGELVQRLTPHISRLSCIVFVALRWDRARMEFADRVRGMGVACRTLVVDAPARSGGATRAGTPPPVGVDLVHVPTQAIESGEALLL